MRSIIRLAVLLFFILICAPLEAQKIKTEGLGYYNYIHPRASVALDGMHNYFIHVSTQDGEAYRRELIEEGLKIETYQRVQDRNQADFMLQIEEAEFTFGSSSKRSISGGENAAPTYYYVGTIEYHYLFRVLNTEGEELSREIVRGTLKTSGRTSTSVRDAHSNYISDKHKFKEACAKEAATKLGDWFKNHFLDVEKTIHLRAATVKNKKYEYPGFQTSFEDLVSIYHALDMGAEIDEEHTLKRDACISFWLEFLSDKTPEDKKSRINASVTAAAYYNLGLVYFFDRQFEKASHCFDEATLYDKGVVAGLMNLSYLSKDCTERLSNH